MATFIGLPGADNFDGTDDDDVFKLFQGGSDTANGHGGVDLFIMRDQLDAGDTLNGGGGDDDTVRLEGDYSAGLVFGADTITNIERLELKGAFAYDLTLDDGNLTSGQRLVVDARQTTAATVDGSSEELGKFVFIGGVGDDGFAGGGQADKFQLRSGGSDKVAAGDGDDTFKMKGAFDAADHINGEGGTGDTLLLKGDYGAAVTFTATTLVNVETILLQGKHDYNLVLDEATVGAAQSLTIDGSSVNAAHSVIIDASDESNSAVLTIKGGDGDDSLTGSFSSDALFGGAGDDVLDSEAGADAVHLGTGNDTVRSDDPGDSTSTAYDILFDFDAHNDVFDVDISVADYAGEVSGTVDADAGFDGDIAAAVDATMDSFEAVILNVTGGNLAGQIFLVLDQNGDGSYALGDDWIWNFSSPANLASFDENNFT